MSSRIEFRILVAAIALTLIIILIQALSGCSGDNPLQPTLGAADGDDPFADAVAKGVEIDFQDGATPPAAQVIFDAAGRSVTCWPYTGTALDGTPSDPISLVLTGEADILAIRQALLALDGDRTAFGFPAAYPFDQPWADCIGGTAQVTWESDAGWAGSVIQLTVGAFEPLRVHLRLFRVDDSLTLGAAHFEVLIPGTADHQVLSWEIAEQMVVADLVRAGLLAAGTAPGSTGPITETPSFRTIPAMIYNSLPAELAGLVGTAQPVDQDVPLPNDGAATVLQLAGLPAVTPDHATLSHTANYDQYVPRPFCSTGPYDWLYVVGQVHFDADIVVDGTGHYRLVSSYTGELQATPVNPATGEVLGTTFSADVTGRQNGLLGPDVGRILALDRKLTHETEGAQITRALLQVNERGRSIYRGFDRCFDEYLTP